MSCFINSSENFIFPAKEREILWKEIYYKQINAQTNKKKLTTTAKNKNDWQKYNFEKTGKSDTSINNVEQNKSPPLWCKRSSFEI